MPPPDSFVVELRASGHRLEIGPDRSILEEVEKHVPVDFTCRKGECGSCVQKVLEGRPAHRDTVLSKRAKEAGKRITICVSRSETDVLVLDL
ncbi:2Fe-2S iron-sulfur cluster-binding protein [Nakamurella alba]|uniref:2Fe-2S iron-sulfur cluster-binding protein n=1 Tax=Nakamurella alba TaxID=2665158 RepID=UPI002AC32440|nr:2Fe-2S iron-sulfur cluster binding domain-containing protein [Nakamurella alba]